MIVSDRNYIWDIIIEVFGFPMKTSATENQQVCYWLM